MNEKIKEILNEYEIIKQLSEKYSDLEFVTYNEFISRSSENKCDVFEINYDRFEQQPYVKIGFKEFNKNIWIDHAYYMKEIYDLDNYLNGKNLNSDFVKNLRREIKRYLKNCYY